jgi:RNA polymerase sigma-70 factor (ECF subfamily)
MTDDAELLRRHLAGDPAAFGELVRRHRDRMFSVAVRLLGDREDAADAVQDAFVSALRAAAGFRGDAAVSTWLHRVVVNASLDIARRRRPVPLPPEELVAHADRAESGPGETGAVLDLLRALPVEQAAAIVLVDVHGFPVREAAEILQVPEGTVKSRCARGRGRLAELLGQRRNQPGRGRVPGQEVQPGGAPV